MTKAFAQSFLCIALLIDGISVHADENTSDTIGTHSRPSEWRLGLENVKLPNDNSVGLLGASYLFHDPSSHFSIGPAVYGAVTGGHGGLFTLGGETSWRQPLTSHTDVEAGLYVGGGGGHAAPVGGGLMLRPHIDLMWNWGGMRTGVSVSRVDFPSGTIRSNQVGLIVAFDDHFLYTGSELVGQQQSLSERAGVGFDRIAITATTYRPSKSSTTATDASQSIGLAGIRAEQQQPNGMFWGLEAAGAGKGSASGYAEVLGTLGWETPILTKDLHVGIRGALGAGGGGSVSVGSGLLSKVGLYSRYELSHLFYLGLEGGYVAAPTHDFRAPYGMLSVGMTLDHPSKNSSENTLATVHGWEWSSSLEHYVSAARKEEAAHSLETLGIKVQRVVDNSPFYLTGQAQSAYAGGAGAYSVGLVGIGAQSPSNRIGLSLGGELLAGVAGGGGVNTQGGAIVQPMGYTSLDITKNWRVKLGVGKVESIHSGLNSTVVDVSLSYRFGLPSR